MDIDVIAENLTELLTNTVNMTSVFYDIFLNPTPMDVELQQYDNNNELITVTIPNRAKDRKIALDGEGSPEGVIEAPVGTAYVDLLTNHVYFKTSGDDQYGWTLILDQRSAEDLIASYLNVNGYLKYSDVINTISDTSTNSKVPSAKAVYDYVEDRVENLIVQEINEESETDKVPSAKVVYDFIGGIDIDNLKNKITNCILEAPNGVLTYYSSTLVAHSELKVLISDGRNEDGTLKNSVYVLPNDVTFTYNYNMEILNDVIFIKSDDTIFRLQDSYVFAVDKYDDLSNLAGLNQYGAAYVKDDNKWYYTSDTGITWEEYLITPIGYTAVNADNSIKELSPSRTVRLLTEEDLNGKANVDLSNVSTSKAILEESYVNGTSWYRVYSDGWCEQGGYVATDSSNITFLKAIIFFLFSDSINVFKS